MQPKVLIRADGGPSIGLGHLVRCSALAHMLKNNFEIDFYCIEIPKSIEKVLKENDFGLVKIQNEEQFFCTISSNHIVVLDGYDFNTSYQLIIKKIGCKLVCIDDFYDQVFVADLIINHAPGITPENYKAQTYTQFALGLEYALLRPAFLEQAQKQRIIENIESVMICFGGSDYNNLTINTLRSALEFKAFKKIIVVTGASYQISDEFKKLLKTDYRIDHRHTLNEKQMLNTMLEAELAIVPSSGILFEALAAGCQAISGYYIDNQKSIYNGFKNMNEILGANNFESLKSIIENLFKRKKFYAEKAIDGESGLRLLKIFKTYAHNTNIS
ncbi:MAG: UDP-2,4-diacetamido-2,4,6-trideoxy-beta-L-altropyranose hydrolase [Prolixibacteraceae bacterium]|jgi:UDP-2,4-diacetamido-2,4,6-trideoxy-beta-L-altropyranose hydrolase|nr:UDP-2,4-diacetamido-2,4,6-trideoxy-beta-L-altropyranose hydrolase [Prolixibacteraceae bacterium]